MTEKLTKMLGDFLERNKNYAIEIYFRNGITGNLIVKMLISDGYLKQEKEKCIIGGNIAELDCEQIILPYNEIMDCYEERDEYNQQTVYVILKNSMIIEFERCGMRM